MKVKIWITVILSFLLSSSVACANRHEHTIVKQEGIAPTCESIGMTDGEYCVECGMILKMPEAIPAKGLAPTEIFELAEKASAKIATFNKSGITLYSGSGFVANEGGMVVTNYHVIEGANMVVATIDGVEYIADQVLAYDADKDVALLQLALGEGQTLPFLKLCDALPKAGERVYAIGNPQGYVNTFSDGIVTCAQREIGGVKYVQHNAATSTGSSGGALLNAYGEVVGIVTSSVKNSQNLNFAVAVSEIDGLSFDTSLSVEEFGALTAG